MSLDRNESRDEISKLLDSLEGIIDDLSKKLFEQSHDNTQNTQLKEISKTIERLEKYGVAVPDSLRAEKSKLFSLISETNSFQQILFDIQERLSSILKSLSERQNLNARKANQPIARRLNPTTTKTQDYTFTKITRVFVIDEWFLARNWSEVKKVVYNKLLSHLKNEDLVEADLISNNLLRYKRPIALNGGYFTEGNRCANDHIKQSKIAIQIAGFDPDADMIFETIPE